MNARWGRLSYHPKKRFWKPEIDDGPSNALLFHIRAAHGGQIDPKCPACKETEAKYGRGKVDTNGI
jgi:hypothetical protein